MLGLSGIVSSAGARMKAMVVGVAASQELDRSQEYPNLMFVSAPPMEEQFASDNYSGICPEAIEALLQANQGSTPAYGEDPCTQAAADEFRRLFETDCEVFFVFNGTAGNSLALASLCQSYHSVVCSDLAHVETDECGAPEFFSNGAKLLLGRNV